MRTYRTIDEWAPSQPTAKPTSFSATAFSSTPSTATALTTTALATTEPAWCVRKYLHDRGQ